MAYKLSEMSIEDLEDAKALLEGHRISISDDIEVQCNIENRAKVIRELLRRKVAGMIEGIGDPIGRTLKELRQIETMLKGVRVDLAGEWDYDNLRQCIRLQIAVEKEINKREKV